MTAFWLRIIIFSLLWVYEISIYSNFIPGAIIFFAITLGIYFLLFIPRHYVWKYSGLLVSMMFYSFFLSNDSVTPLIFLLYITIDAVFRVSYREFIIVFIETTVFSFVLFTVSGGLTVEGFIFYSMLAFLCFQILNGQVERREQAEIYEELLGEYRSVRRLHVQMENNAKLEERTRIARDIHDSVGHRLTALIMQLEMLKIQENNEAFGELKEMAVESLEETRSAVKALQTEEVEGIAAVIQLIRKLEAESHLLIRFTLNQGVLSVPLTNEMSVVLYRVIQESLTNIMRHGDTRNAHVTLGKTATNDILFEITNPIRERKPFQLGFGLKNMQERVEEVNGSLRVYQTDEEFIVTGKIGKGGN